MTPKRFHLSALIVVVLTGTLSGAWPVAAGVGDGNSDALTKARLAAIEGRHGDCVELAKVARKQHPNLWQAKQVYASCTAIDAQKRKAELGPDAYEAKVLDAIEVMERIIEDDSSMPSRQRLQFSYMAIDMRNQLKTDLAKMRGGTDKSAR